MTHRDRYCERISGNIQTYINGLVIVADFYYSSFCLINKMFNSMFVSFKLSLAPSSFLFKDSEIIILLALEINYLSVLL